MTNKTQSMVFVAILVAIHVVLTRFLAIQTPIVRIGFGFIPIALSAMLFGPFVGGLTAALADIVGMIIFPKGAYFPGFTLSAFLGGMIYGVFLYNRPKSKLNVFFAVFCISLGVNLGLNTLWISILTGEAYKVIMLPRIMTQVILLPIQTLLIYATWQYLGKYVSNKIMQFK